MRMFRGRCYLLVCAVIGLVVYAFYCVLNRFSSQSIDESLHRKAFRHHLGNNLHYESILYPSYPTRPHRAESDESDPDNKRHEVSLNKPMTSLPARDQLETGEDELTLERIPSNSDRLSKSSSTVTGRDLKVTDRSMQIKLRNYQLAVTQNNSDADTLPKQILSKKESRKNSPFSASGAVKHRETVPSLSASYNSNRSVNFIYTNFSDLNSRHLSSSKTSRRDFDVNLIKEQRRQATSKRKQMQDKVWFQQDVVEIMKGVREGGVVEVQKKPDEGPPGEVDPSQWEGLNSGETYHRYPGIVLFADYVLCRPFVAPNDTMAAGMQGDPHSIDDLTDGQIEERFYQLISMAHVDCRLLQRMGSMNDGGWDLCTVPPFLFKPGCLVYSFGINYDFTFDDAMALAFNCTVKSFDPSMTVKDYIRSSNVLFYQLGIGAENTVTDKGWKLMSLQSIRSKLGHSKTVIDVIKIDIDYGEWACLMKMADDGSLILVKQLIFEMHTSEVETVQRPTSRDDFMNMYETLNALERAGFRRYNYHYNTLGQYTSVRTGKTRSCCYELYYVNIRFLKQ